MEVYEGQYGYGEARIWKGLYWCSL